jgi:hypothetical protein
MIVKKILIENQFVPDLPQGSIYVSCYLNPDGETYTVEGLTMWGNAPYTISQLQGMLQLDRLGLLEQVEAMIEQSGTPGKIYWKTAQNWEKTSPILNRLAPMIWPENTEENLDKFFIDAKKLN